MFCTVSSLLPPEWRILLIVGPAEGRVLGIGLGASYDQSAGAICLVGRSWSPRGKHDGEGL